MTRFDELAKQWDDNPLRRNMAMAVADTMIAQLNLSKTMKALEIGSGTGLVTLKIAAHVGSIRALDSSKNMMAELSKKTEALDIDNVTPEYADLDQGTIPGDSYDLIFSNMTFHHIDGIEVLIAKIHDALAPGGMIVVTDLDKEDGSFHGDVEGIRHLGFTRGHILNAFEHAGFHRCTINDAHIMEKKSTHGDMRQYPIFIATGLKKKA